MKVFQTASDKFVGSVILYKGNDDKLYKNKELTKEVTDKELLELFKTNNVLVNETEEEGYTLKKIISITVNDDGTITYSTESGSENIIEEVIVEKEICNDTYTLTQLDDFPNLYVGHYNSKIDNINEGDKIKVNNEIFEVKCIELYGEDQYYIGNPKLLFEDVEEDTGEDICITIQHSQYDTTSIILNVDEPIEQQIELEYNMSLIDEKKLIKEEYLPFSSNEIHFDVEYRDGSAPIINSDVTFNQLTSIFNDSNHDINCHISLKNASGEKSRFLGNNIIFHEPYDQGALPYFSIESYLLERDGQNIISIIFELEIYSNDEIELYTYDNYTGGSQPS